MKPRAVAWDIDGTLLDSEGLHHDAFEAACRHWKVDLSAIGPDYFRGVNVHDVWKVISPLLPAGLSEAEWSSTVDRYYIEHVPQIKPVPGALEAVRTIDRAGLPQICVSNSSRMVVNANLTTEQLAGFFKFSISLGDVLHGKPDPAPYAIGCALLRLEPGEVLAVEDSIPGIRSARAAGLVVAGYTGTHGSGDEAHFTIRHLREVLPLLGLPPLE